MLEIRGVGLGMVTPFTKDDEVDVGGIERNLGFALENGVHNINPAATSGEGALLSVDEYEKVVGAVVERVGGRVSVTPGAPGTTPQAIIDRVRLAGDLGADGAYLSTPAYFKPTQEGLHAHFGRILGSVDSPIVIYNAVHRSAVDMSPEVVARLHEEFSNLVGYKEPSLLKMGKILHLTGRKLALISEDWLFVPALALGASAVASVAANIVPRMEVDMYEAFVRGDMEGARSIQIRFVPLMEALGIGGGGRETSPGPIKEAMNMLGLAAGKPRLPIVPVDEETKRELREVLSELIPSMRVV